MFSLPFSVLAEDTYQKYSFDSVYITYSATGKRVYGALTTSPGTTPEDGATTSIIFSGEGYDQYISTDMVVAESENTYIQSELTSNGFNDYSEKYNINYIGFDAGIIGSGYLNELEFEPVAIMVNGEIIENSFTASIVSTQEASYNYPSGGSAVQVTYSYYRLKVRIRLNDNFRFRNSDDVKFILRSEAVLVYDYYSGTSKPTQYRIGINNLEVGNMTTDDFIESTANDVNEIKDKVSIIGSTVSETQNIVNNIYNIINQTITPEQQAIIDQNNIMIQDRNELESSLDDDFSQLVENININDYQMIDGNNFDNGNVDVNQNVLDFNNSGMGNFFRSLWELDFIKTAVLLSLGFLGIKIGIYGV